MDSVDGRDRRGGEVRRGESTGDSASRRAWYSFPFLSDMSPILLGTAFLTLVAALRAYLNPAVVKIGGVLLIALIFLAMLCILLAIGILGVARWKEQGHRYTMSQLFLFVTLVAVLCSLVTTVVHLAGGWYPV